MAGHQRRRPKNRRSGCLLCKCYKINGAPPESHMSISELRRLGRSRRLVRGDLGDHLDDE
jgi:hypothetical protein